MQHSGIVPKRTKFVVMLISTAVYLSLTAVFVYTLLPFFQQTPVHQLAAPIDKSIAVEMQLPNIASPEIKWVESTIPQPMVESENATQTHSYSIAPNNERNILSRLEPPEEVPIQTGGSSVTTIPITTSIPAAFGELIIPAIGVYHKVTAVPVVDGSWDISQLEAQVGHLQTTGIAPGDNLAMTFIGHVTLPWPGVGPFADLILLEHGEEIIYRWNGNDYVYEVSRIFKVNPEDVHILYHEDPNSIQIATCSGWDLIDRDYNKRLVTRATLVRVEPTPFK